MRQFRAAAALAAVLVASFAVTEGAFAQADKSIEDTINALTPRPGASRGSRPVVAPPSNDASTAATPSYTAPAAAATPAPAPARAVASAPAAAPAAAPAGAPSVDFNIQFATGSAELSPAAAQTLETLGKALSSPRLAGQSFRIEGHTDTVGSRDGNKALSASRAATVVNVLSQKYGIAPSRLEAVGVGEDQLVVPTGDQVAEPRNRIVRIINVTG